MTKQRLVIIRGSSGVEGIFVNERYGDMLRKLVNDFRGRVYVYYLDISIEVTVQRHSSKLNAHEFGEKELQEWWAEKNYLNVPQEKMITDDLSRDEILKMFIRDMKIVTRSHTDFMH